MDKLYVCKAYETPYEDELIKIGTVKEHDKKIIQQYVDKVVKELNIQIDEAKKRF